jgi:hypothetical protein
VEIAPDAVAHAANAYGRENLSFLRGDARALPLPDASRDVVVSFETIEHFAEHQRFLEEVRRVLRPGGLLVVSTPDRDNYSPTDTPANPYHVKELTGAEFHVLMRCHFAHVAVWWQRALRGSVLVPGPGVSIAGETLTFERRGADHFEVSTKYPRPQYWVAVCSDEDLKEIPASIYIETSQLDAREDDLRRTLSAEQDRIRSIEAVAYNTTLRAEAAESRAQLAEARVQSDTMAIAAIEAAARAAEARAGGAEAAARAADARASGTEAAARAADTRASGVEAAAHAAEIVAREAQGQAAATRLALDQERMVAERLRQDLADQTRALASLHASTSWRLTAPLRAVRKLVGRRSD